MTSRDATEADAELIDEHFRSIFTETFAHLYEPEDLAAFMAKFTVERWRIELADPRFAFRIAELDGRPAGYVKIGPMDLPANHGDKPIELYQFYLHEEARGRGIARELMSWTIGRARAMGGEELFLSVFTENHRARRFYERFGFTKVGPYHFMVGSQADEDVIMRLAL